MSDGHPFQDEFDVNHTELANDNDPPWVRLTTDVLYRAFGVDVANGDRVPNGVLIAMALSDLNLSRKRMDEIIKWWSLWGTLPDPIVTFLENRAAAFQVQPRPKAGLTVVEGGR